MKVLQCGVLVLAVAGAIDGGGPAHAQSSGRRAGDHASARNRLIGAWHLYRIDAGDGGKEDGSPQPAGMLLYTADGHMSVQLMYAAEHGVSNEYVSHGYEASFGSYEVDEVTHTLTHHVQGSVTRELLVGKDLPRVFAFTAEGRLVLRSADAREHWSVTWEHY